MIITRVVLEARLVYEIMAPLKEFADWVNGVAENSVYVNEFKAWVRKDGTMIYIDRASVMAAYGKEIG